MVWIKKHQGIFAGIILGGIGGFLYWYFVGCVSGKCMMISLWYNSTIYGALLGGLTGNALSKTTPETKDEQKQSS